MQQGQLLAANAALLWALPRKINLPGESRRAPQGAEIPFLSDGGIWQTAQTAG
ncbi:MAG: hypothetical protein CM15mP46_1090 [Alphaproteobacteria bacterium]|nr:MAG: hypothetical protein CM15mP46_1090 [Alphaproteobacteria bacterium]